MQVPFLLGTVSVFHSVADVDSLFLPACTLARRAGRGAGRVRVRLLPSRFRP